MGGMIGGRTKINRTMLPTVSLEVEIGFMFLMMPTFPYSGKSKSLLPNFKKESLLYQNGEIPAAYGRLR